MLSLSERLLGGGFRGFRLLAGPADFRGEGPLRRFTFRRFPPGPGARLEYRLWGGLTITLTSGKEILGCQYAISKGRHYEGR